MLSMINRGRIKDLAVVQEFEHLIARLRGFLSQSFDEDGQLIVADPNLAVMPVAGIIPFGGTTAPSGWLLCDGSQVSRVSYKSLFDVIGTTYGAGDGSTTFNVPDMRGRFPLGKATAGTGSTLGSTGGALDHTHTISGSTSSAGDHSHSISSDGSHSHGGNTGSTSIDHSHGMSALQSAATGTAGGVTVDNNLDGSTTSCAVSGHAHFTVSGGGSGPTDSAGGSHNHSIGSDGSHSHGGNTGSAGSHSHTVSGTAAAGGNPPFQVANYIIFAGV